MSDTEILRVLKKRLVKSDAAGWLILSLREDKIRNSYFFHNVRKEKDVCHLSLVVWVYNEVKPGSFTIVHWLFFHWHQPQNVHLSSAFSSQSCVEHPRTVRDEMNVYTIITEQDVLQMLTSHHATRPAWSINETHLPGRFAKVSALVGWLSLTSHIPSV